MIGGALQILEKSAMRWGNWGAIQDLAPGGSAIAKLNCYGSLAIAKGIPVHAYCSILNMENAHNNAEVIDNESAGWYDKTIGYFFKKVKEKIPTGPDFLNWLFDGADSDGVVPFTSQLGGLNNFSWYKDDYKGFLGFDSSAHHCNITDEPEAILKIIKLLHEPKTSESFEDGFAPVNLSSRFTRADTPDEVVEFKDPSESQFIKIQAEKVSTARIVWITANGSEDLWSNIVFASLDDENLLCGMGQDEYLFRVPDEFGGDLTFYALGRTEDDALVGDSVTVHFDAEATPVSLYFEDRPEITMTKGQLLELNVVSIWSNGEEKYIIPKYKTDNDGILTIDGGMIAADEAGKCLLIANYAGLTDTLSVTVAGNTENSIRSVEKEKPSVSYNNGTLTLSANDSFSGVLTVEIYDLAGTFCCRQRDDVVIKAGDTVRMDISSLPSQFYIARIRTANDSRSIKFYKRN